MTTKMGRGPKDEGKRKGEEGEIKEKKIRMSYVHYQLKFLKKQKNPKSLFPGKERKKEEEEEMTTRIHLLNAWLWPPGYPRRST